MIGLNLIDLYFSEHDEYYQIYIETLAIRTEGGATRVSCLTPQTDAEHFCYSVLVFMFSFHYIFMRDFLFHKYVSSLFFKDASYNWSDLQFSARVSRQASSISPKKFS